jgi:uncharacterized protein involved in exopolysaccharide biosynthesis
MKRDAWKNVARFLARLYPSRWRERYGDEFDALLEDASPKSRDPFDILWGAFRMQITTWTFGRITLACALIGVLAAVAISFTLPVSYRSEARIKITPEQMPESGNMTATNRLIWDRVPSMAQEILSPRVLTAIIQQHDLYPRERTRLPLDDVVENMRKHILVALLAPRTPSNRLIPAFAIQFDYPDARVAQQVTAALVARFIEANLRQGMTDRDINPKFGMQLAALDSASLPTRPSGPNRATITGAGLLAGLLAGVTLAFVIRSRRRTAV